MLLTADLYPSVRAVLDISLDDTALPDEIIEKPVFAGGAELDVLERDSLAETRTGTTRRHLINAAIYFCAARLAPAIPSIVSENLGDYSYSRSAVDWNKRAASLLAQAEQEIAAVVSPGSSSASYPTFFAVASGSRGR
jgi:hypothetical protein